MSKTQIYLFFAAIVLVFKNSKNNNFDRGTYIEEHPLKVYTKFEVRCLNRTPNFKFLSIKKSY